MILSILWYGLSRILATANELRKIERTVLREDYSSPGEQQLRPVAWVIEVDDEEQAVRLANDSPFGLGATVFDPPDRARSMARKLDAGMIGINRGPGGAEGTPWVGARESGFSFHGSAAGHRNFTQTRVVSERA